MNTMTTVLVKELRELSRDRKTLMMTLFMSPLMILLMVFGLGNFMEKKVKRESEKPLEIAIVGAERAPNLVAFLAAQGITAKQVKDPDAAIRNQDENVYVRIGDDFAKQWGEGKPALVEVVADSTRQDARIPSERVRKTLEAYGQQMGALRLLARGIDPSVSAPLAVSDKDLSTETARRGSVMASFLPYILLLGSLVGILAFVIDITAGERERQSLEPLLTTPASRGRIVSGKVAAAIAIGVVGALITCVAFKLGAQQGGVIGKMMDVSGPAIAKVLLILVPIVAFNACLLTLIAAGAKSVKEAQSFMGLLTLLPALPSIFLMVNPVKTQLWMFAVPYLAQYQAIMKVLRGETISGAEWAVYFGAAALLGSLLWMASVWRYRQEKLAIAS